VAYGPAQAEQKEHFLAELVHICSHKKFPLLMGGDFTILVTGHVRHAPAQF
jgi:hypothetical protein